MITIPLTFIGYVLLFLLFNFLVAWLCLIVDNVVAIVREEYETFFVVVKITKKIRTYFIISVISSIIVYLVKNGFIVFS